MGKCTYVSQYGLKKAKEILSQITNEAVSEIDEYGEKAEFLKQLALYIENRNKEKHKYSVDNNLKKVYNIIVKLYIEEGKYE